MCCLLRVIAHLREGGDEMSGIMSSRGNHKEVRENRGTSTTSSTMNHVGNQ
jgi:hypothetical protein